MHLSKSWASGSVPENYSLGPRAKGKAKHFVG